MAPSVFQLSGTCNNYDWGKKGQHSLAARLCAQTPGTDFRIEEDKPYSEVWFGDYPDFPARKLDTGELLKDVLDANKQQLLGTKVIKEYEAQLPYLPKILSIAKALPLQLHPDKELASKLHQKDPQNFTDPNHKPEIAVALSKFEVFAGFKPLSKIEPLFKLPFLKQFVPDQTGDWSDGTLRDVCRNLLKANLQTVEQVQNQLSQLEAADLGDAAYILLLLPRLQAQYGSQDAGNLVALLCMNFFIFEAGDAIYIPADGIHAYLSGDIVECMARSNNVLNTGFCPPADRNSADLFAETLTFKAQSVDDVYLPAEESEKSKEGRTVVYKPELSEFNMLKTDLQAGESDEISASEGPGVMIVTEGEGSLKADGREFRLKDGYIFFIGHGVSVKFETKSERGLQVHMAVV